MPKSDCLLISPHINTFPSNLKVMQIKEMITNCRSSWLLNKFSLSTPWEMYREQCGEYAYWCWGVMGFTASYFTASYFQLAWSWVRSTTIVCSWIQHIFTSLWISYQTSIFRICFKVNLSEFSCCQECEQAPLESHKVPHTHYEVPCDNNSCEKENHESVISWSSLSPGGGMWYSNNPHIRT